MANILVFDSGMGGLTIYREIRRALPAHNYFYCFDNANFPYGELSESALIAACTRLGAGKGGQQRQRGTQAEGGDGTVEAAALEVNSHGMSPWGW